MLVSSWVETGTRSKAPLESGWREAASVREYADAFRWCAFDRGDAGWLKRCVPILREVVEKLPGIEFACTSGGTNTSNPTVVIRDNMANYWDITGPVAWKKVQWHGRCGHGQGRPAWVVH